MSKVAERLIREALSPDAAMVLFGCGGHARSVINTIRRSYGEQVRILLVDENAAQNEEILGCRAVASYELTADDRYLIAIGDNAKRRSKYEQLLARYGGQCICVLSADSHIGLAARIGKGTYIASGAEIGPQAVIGDNTIINTGSVIEHETVVGDHVHVAPGTVICGRCKIGNGVFCGAGSVVIDKINICDNVVIGAGAVVTGDIAESGTYVGVPARKIIRR